MSNRLPILAADIRRSHANVQEAAKSAAEHAIEAGKGLIEAKALVKHGQWLPWLKEHCAMPERTAQLYMKIAKSGHSAETVAAIGLKGAEQSLVLKYGYHRPMFEGEEATRREWCLFALYLSETAGWHPSGAVDHTDWIGRHDFKTVHEWLTEGRKWMAAIRWPGEAGDVGDHSERFKDFCKQYDGATIDDLMARLQELVEEAEQARPNQPEKRTRRKRKNATVADLGGA